MTIREPEEFTRLKLLCKKKTIIQEKQLYNNKVIVQEEYKYTRMELYNGMQPSYKNTFIIQRKIIQ